MTNYSPIEYDGLYIQSKGWNKFGVISIEDAAVLHAELTKFYKRGDSLLEIGFGNGGVATWCKNNGIRWIGIEVNTLLVEAANAQGFEAYSSLSEVPIEFRFTGALAFDVIEHIDGSLLVKWLEEIAEFVIPGGLLLLRFPNGDSPFGRIAQNADPTHINAIGRGKLLHYCSATEWDLISLRAPFIPIKGVGWIRGIKRLIIVIFRKIIGQICRIVFFGGVFIPMDSNYFAVLQKSK